MTDPLLDNVVTRARRQAHKRHSEAYRWLREYYAELAPVFADKQPPWREIAAELVAGGMRGGKGKVLTARALAGIWARVCSDVAAAEAKRQAAQQKRALQPSRIPADWRPTSASSQPLTPRTQPPLLAHVHERSGKDPYADLPEHARRTMESLDRQLAYRDRFVNPPKRQG